jgi:GTP-binding protein
MEKAHKHFVLIGRPNSGKSSIINFLLKKREAKVRDEEGTTQDWREVKFDGFSIWDTPGVFKIESMPPCEIYKVLFVVENHVLEIDKVLYRKLRSKYDSSVIVNKIDLGYEDYSYFHDYVAISAKQSINIEGLKRVLEVDRLIKDEAKTRLWAFIGKPNVGKSSIINALIKQDRHKVKDEEGTTKEFLPINIDSDYFLDTPGQRGKAEFPQYADVFGLIVVLDLKQERQDLRIIDLAIKRRRPTIIVLNKIDLEDGNKIKTVMDKINLFWDLPIIKTSCIKGRGIEELRRKKEKMEEVYFSRIKTHDLNEWLNVNIRKVEPKIKYMSQIESAPPKFYIDCELKADKEKMVKRRLAREFGLEGIPILIKFPDKTKKEIKKLKERSSKYY